MCIDMDNRFITGTWKYALVGVIAFLIGSAAVATAAGPMKLSALSDETGTKVVDVTESGELLVNAMGSDVAVTQTSQPFMMFKGL